LLVGHQAAVEKDHWNEVHLPAEKQREDGG